MLEGSCYKSPEWNPKQWVIGAWVGVGTSGVGYTSTYGYDPNGNITNLTRKDRAGVSFDNLSYTYTDPTATETAITNRLDHITDGVSNNTQTYDLKTQSAVNYTYDQIGYLTADNTEGISSITWNASGKVTKVVKPTVETSFLYDGLGNRVRKFVDKTGTTNDVNTYYVRDASGNVMSTYEKIGANGDLKQIEAPIYGSDRLGMEKPNNLIRYNDINNDLVSTTETMFKRTLGLKQYELKDHLGNVRVVLGDKKIRTGTGLTYPFKPEVVSYSNYYPFGMQMQENNQMAPGGDTWQNAITGYRYGYNGQEMDKDINSTGNITTAEFWEYDSRAARRWNRDPRPITGISEYTVFNDNPIAMSDPYGDRPTPRQAARMARHTYKDLKDTRILQNFSNSWKVSKRVFDDVVLDHENGLKSTVYERTNDGKTEYVYAMAGTDLTSLIDWLNDASQLVGLSAQYELAIKNASKISEQLGSSELTLVGHSLGGGEASASAHITGRSAITFNAAGLSGFTVKKNAEAKIDAYILTTDPLNLVQNGSLLPDVNGTRIKLYPTDLPSIFNGHSMDNMLKSLDIDISKYYYPEKKPDVQSTIIKAFIPHHIPMSF
ncbi:MAG: hypothetical protein IPM69_17065 [Ignavibacteria bacterium]|nr:hypothetical protein [Ignavibacteria bacterium]